MSKHVRPRHSSDYDAFDMFCGAGGTSEGNSRRGVRIKADDERRYGNRVHYEHGCRPGRQRGASRQRVG